MTAVEAERHRSLVAASPRGLPHRDGAPDRRTRSQRRPRPRPRRRGIARPEQTAPRLHPAAAKASDGPATAHPTRGRVPAAGLVHVTRCTHSSHRKATGECEPAAIGGPERVTYVDACREQPGNRGSGPGCQNPGRCIHMNSAVGGCHSRLSHEDIPRRHVERPTDVSAARPDQCASSDALVVILQCGEDLRSLKAVRSRELNEIPEIVCAAPRTPRLSRRSILFSPGLPGSHAALNYPALAADACGAEPLRERDPCVLRPASGWRASPATPTWLPRPRASTACFRASKTSAVRIAVTARHRKIHRSCRRS